MVKQVELLLMRNSYTYLDKRHESSCLQVSKLGLYAFSSQYCLNLSSLEAKMALAAVFIA
jgi:hypothetical protein